MTSTRGTSGTLPQSPWWRRRQTPTQVIGDHVSVPRLLLDNARDVKNLGPRFLFRRASRLIGRRTTRVPIRNVGTVTLRHNSSDGDVFRQVFRDRQYDLARFPQAVAVEAAYQRIIGAGKKPLIVDCGANNGAGSLWFARQYREAHIVALEPEPANAQMCRLNCRDIGVEVIEAAIGSRTGTVSLVTEGKESLAIQTTRSATGRVPVATIPEIFAANVEVCTPFLVKIDIEGFESDLFAEATDWVRDVVVLVIEPHDYMLPGTSHNLQRVMARHDFDLLISGENLVYVNRERTNV